MIKAKTSVSANNLLFSYLILLIKKVGEAKKTKDGEEVFSVCFPESDFAEMRNCSYRVNSTRQKEKGEFVLEITRKRKQRGKKIEVLSESIVEEKGTK